MKANLNTHSNNSSNKQSDNSVSSPAKNSNQKSINSSENRTLVMKLKEWGRKNTGTNLTTNTGGTVSNNS
jgi:hypothetical protein